MTDDKQGILFFLQNKKKSHLNFTSQSFKTPQNQNR